MLLGISSRRAVGRVALKTFNRARARAAASPAALLQLPSTLLPPQPPARGIFGGGGLSNPGGGGVPAKKEEGETAVAKPIDFDVSARVEGQETQIVVVDLEPGQVLRADTGSLLYMTEGVEIETSLGGGLSAGMKRYMTGQGAFITDYRFTGEAGHGTVCLGTEYPSKILKLSLADHGGSLICQKGAFMAANSTVGIEMEMARSLKAGFFGGEGFVLQRLTGDGDVFVKAGGALIRRELEPGETLRVTTGALVAFAPSVTYDVQMMKGVKNVMFGGEGLFVTALTGPGTVYLQSMPFDRLVGEIARRVPGGGGLAFGVPLGMAGGAGGEAAEAGAEGGEGGDDGGGVGEAAASSSAAGAGFGSAASAFGGGGAGEASSGAGASSGGFEQQQAAQAAQADQRAEEVWSEEKGEGFEEGEEGFDEDGGGEGGGVAETLGNIWDIFK